MQVGFCSLRQTWFALQPSSPSGRTMHGPLEPPPAPPAVPPPPPPPEPPEPMQVPVVLLPTFSQLSPCAQFTSLAQPVTQNATSQYVPGLQRVPWQSV